MKYLLITVALFEAGTGLFLLFLPSVLLMLLFGLRHALPETLLLGRLAGVALLSIGAASWLARNDNRSGAQLGLVTGLLIQGKLDKLTVELQPIKATLAQILEFKWSTRD